jgi:hypothetical protein
LSPHLMAGRCVGSSHAKMKLRCNKYIAGPKSTTKAHHKFRHQCVPWTEAKALRSDLSCASWWIRHSAIMAVSKYGGRAHSVSAQIFSRLPHRLNCLAVLASTVRGDAATSSQLNQLPCIWMVCSASGFPSCHRRSSNLHLLQPTSNTVTSSCYAT